MLAGGVTPTGTYLVTELAADAARRCDHPAVLATVLALQAQGRRSAHELAEALATIEAAEAAARRSGSISLVGYVLGRRSALVAEQGDPQGAVTIALDAVAAARRGPNRFFLMDALDALGRRFAQVEDDDAAVGAYRELLDLALDVGAAVPAARAHLELAGLAMAADDLEAARRHLDGAVAVLEPVAPVNPPAFLLLGMAGHARGEALLLEGDLPGARSVFEGTAMAAAAFGIPWVIAFTRVSLGWLCLTEGDLVAADAHFLAATEVTAEPAGHEAYLHHHAAAAGVRGRAAVAWARGDAEGAVELAHSVAHVLEPSDATPRCATTLFRRSVGVLARR